MRTFVRAVHKLDNLVFLKKKKKHGSLILSQIIQQNMNRNLQVLMFALCVRKYVNTYEQVDLIRT